MKSNDDPKYTGYIFTAALGALGGGLLVAFATKAIPKMMSRMMSQMMTSMMSEMGDGDCQPAEM